jgi:hypothetical protein
MCFGFDPFPTAADFSFRMDESAATRGHRLSARGAPSPGVLAAKAEKLARRVLREVATIVTPETLWV